MRNQLLLLLSPSLSSHPASLATFVVTEAPLSLLPPAVVALISARRVFSDRDVQIQFSMPIDEFDDTGHESIVVRDKSR